MLPLFLILLSLGLYCNSAPTRKHLITVIEESWKDVKQIKTSEGTLCTPDNVMNMDCMLQNLNTFIESVNKTTQMVLLRNLQDIQTQLKHEPNQKNDPKECERVKEGIEDFKEKLQSFLAFIKQEKCHL